MHFCDYSSVGTAEPGFWVASGSFLAILVARARLSKAAGEMEGKK